MLNAFSNIAGYNGMVYWVHCSWFIVIHYWLFILLPMEKEQQFLAYAYSIKADVMCLDTKYESIDRVKCVR